MKYKKKKKNNKKKLDSIRDSTILLFEVLHKLILGVSDCVTNSVTILSNQHWYIHAKKKIDCIFLSYKWHRARLLCWHTLLEVPSTSTPFMSQEGGFTEQNHMHHSQGGDHYEHHLKVRRQRISSWCLLFITFKSFVQLIKSCLLSYRCGKILK